MGTLIWVLIIAFWITSLILKKKRMGWEDFFHVVEQFQKGSRSVKAKFDQSTGSYTTASSSAKSFNFNTLFPMNIKRIAYGVGVFLVFILIFNMVTIIPAGATGVVQIFGKVQDKEIQSGIHLINPLANVVKMSIRTEQYTMSIAPAEGQQKGDDSISSLTKEGLEVSIDFTALYRLEESRAADVYREVGLDYVGKLIRPEIRGVIRDIVSQYEAKELYSEKRQEASARMFSLLTERLGSRGVIIEQAVIRNVQLPASLAKAIQEKLAAEQESQRYDFVLEKEKKEADRKRIEAEGQRDSQKIIDESLSPEYLNYMYIRELKDREGTIYVPINPSNGLPMFKGIE